MGNGRVGYMRPGLHPKSHPSMCDIAWAAGIIEGEGTIDSTPSERVTAVQKDPWLIQRLKRLFGGSVRKRISKGFKEGDVYVWMLCGPRARGFIMTTFSFYSPRRKAQAKAALKGKTYATKDWLIARGRTA